MDKTTKMKINIIVKLLLKAFILIILLLIIYFMIKTLIGDKTSETGTNVDSSTEQNENNISGQNMHANEETSIEQNVENDANEISSGFSEVVINDWRLALANYEHILPEDFEIELAHIDEYRQFDTRAIEYLNQMMEAMRNDGILNVWIQSAYRSVKEQKKLYNTRIKEYIAQGESKEEAERLTLEYINKPGASDHNLGLAVDFNYVDNSFEDLQGFEWLKENAEDYGFVLRYPKNKEEITKIKYEPWHWRFVGEENAKKMNELGICLEEYVEAYEQYN